MLYFLNFSRNVPSDAPDLTEWMKAEEAEILERLQQSLGGAIDLVPEDTYPPGKYSLLEG